MDPGPRAGDDRGGLVFESVDVVHEPRRAAPLLLTRCEFPGLRFAAILLAHALSAASGDEGDERRSDASKEKETRSRHG